MDKIKKPKTKNTVVLADADFSPEQPVKESRVKKISKDNTVAISKLHMILDILDTPDMDEKTIKHNVALARKHIQQIIEIL